MEWNVCYQLSKNEGGRDDLVSMSQTIVPLLQAAFIHFFEEAHVISYSDFYERLLLLRNLCFSSNVYVQAILDADIVGQLLLLCRYVTLSTSSSAGGDGYEEDLASTLLEEDVYSFVGRYPDEVKKKTVRAVAQLLANIIKCTERATKQILTRHIIQRDGDRHLGSVADVIAAAMLCKDQAALNAIWMIFVGLASLQSEESSFRTVFDHPRGRSILKQLLMSLHSHERVQSSESDEKSIVNPGGSAEGCQLLCMVLLRQQYDQLLPFYLAIGQQNLEMRNMAPDTSIPNNTPSISLEQVLFLFVLVSVLEEDHGSRLFLTNVNMFEIMFTFLSVINQQLIEGVKVCNFALIQQQQRQQQHQQEWGDAVGSERDVFQEFKGTVWMDFCIVATHLLGAVFCLIDDGVSAANRDGVPPENHEKIVILKAQLSADLIPALSEHVLINRDPVTKRTFDPKRTSETSIDNETDKSVLWIRELVRRALQLLSLVVIRCKEAQMILLTSPGLLGSLLQHCATDFSNPLAREWALLAVRNLCEENEEARTRIEALRPQGVVKLGQEAAEAAAGDNGSQNSSDDMLSQEEAFREAGLSVSLNPRTGKLSVERHIPNGDNKV